MSCREKTISISEIMMPNQANVAGNVHGGVIMHMMDTTAWTAAIKYARSQAVTARVDELQFHRPVYVGNLVTCTATIAYVGNTTMEVKVTTEVEDLLGEEAEPQIALTGYFTMVAMARTANRAGWNRSRRPQMKKSDCMTKGKREESIIKPD